jgi:hypothetical protein
LTTSRQFLEIELLPVAALLRVALLLAVIMVDLQVQYQVFHKLVTLNPLTNLIALNNEFSKLNE